jgi:thiol-disulfide isomerase/thioredoxin
MKNLLSLFVASILLTLSVRGATNNIAADELWQSIQKIEEEPEPHDRAEFVERAGHLYSALLEFERLYPADPRHWDAKLTSLEVVSGLAEVDDKPTDDAALYALAKEIVAAPDASVETKIDARYLTAVKRMEALESLGSVTNGPARAAADAAIQELRQNYPDDLHTIKVQFEMTQFLELRDPGAAESILHELAGSKNPQAAALAQQQLGAMKTQRDLGKAPLDLKFEAVDGSKVDLSKLRGKVVLVDFWATWCGPCRMEIPNVVATYQKLHNQGFEIVGISLDQNKEQMVKFTQAAGMTWPQYFDGKMWSNEISTRYGVSAIPAAWLVDKKGFVRSTQARGADLEQQVKMLLAE